jgi:radical SAM protein with 4Fe4S-binding SPASM domain
MRYLTDIQVFAESLHIGLATGSTPPAFLRPRLVAASSLELEPSTTLPAGTMALLLAEHTASWCLLTPFERDVAESANGATFAAIGERFPAIDRATLHEFFVRLYQRGLLRVDGRPGLDPGLLNEGALYRDGYLVEILVTQKCNLACRYCLAEAGPEMPHLHPEDAYAAVDAAFALPGDRGLMIQLSGGEPFVNFALFKALVTYIEEKQQQTGRAARICTQSNGTLIDDEIARFVKEHQIAIGISCDGPSAFSDLSRPMLGGQPSLERTLRGMEALRRNEVPFGVILVLSRANVGEPETIADFFAERGVRSVKINPISMIGDAQLTWNAMAITPDEYFTFVDRFIDHVTTEGIALSDGNLGQYLQYLIRRVHDYRCMRSNCGAGRSFFLIDAAGEIYPCAHSAGIPAWRLGSIREIGDGLPALGERNPVLQQFPLRLVDQIDEARICPWRHFCEGGCAVNAYQQYGSMLAPDTLCAFYERMYPRLLERLATDPGRFQVLLDGTFGPGQASVVEFALDEREEVAPGQGTQVRGRPRPHALLHQPARRSPRSRQRRGR